MPFSYLIGVTTNGNEDESVMLAILNGAGMGQQLAGAGDEIGNATLWFIPRPRGDRESVVERVQALPLVNGCYLAEWTRPVTPAQLEGVRQLFKNIRWDTSGISDAELEAYVNGLAGSNFRYHLDFGSSFGFRGPLKIYVVESQEALSPEDLQRKTEDDADWPDRELTMDDFEVQEGTFVEVVTLDDEDGDAEIDDDMFSIDDIVAASGNKQQGESTGNPIHE